MSFMTDPKTKNLFNVYIILFLCVKWIPAKLILTYKLSAKMKKMEIYQINVVFCNVIRIQNQ